MGGAHLNLYNVQFEDAGTYRCEAVNSKGKDYHSARLTVEGKKSGLIPDAARSCKVVCMYKIARCDRYTVSYKSVLVSFFPPNYYYSYFLDL